MTNDHRHELMLRDALALARDAERRVELSETIDLREYWSRQADYWYAVAYPSPNAGESERDAAIRDTNHVLELQSRKGTS